MYGSYEGGVEFLVSSSLRCQKGMIADGIKKKKSLLRLLLGIVIAGMWPGMTYYLSLFYPPSRMGKRIGRYFTAAQVSAAVVGLVSAGFQKMDGMRGYVGFQWMFLVYGVVTIAFGLALLWWLPDRPSRPGTATTTTASSSSPSSGPRTLLGRVVRLWRRLRPQSPPALTGRDAQIHYHDLTRVYHNNVWSLRDLLRVMLDWRLWPLLIMYFGVVGVGIGTQNYGTVIIRATNPSLSDIEVSLLFAPIWVVRFLRPH